MQNACVDVVERQLEAYNSRDIEKFLSFYHDEVLVYSLPGKKPTSVGKEKIRPIYTRLFQENPDLHCNIKSRMTMGQYVIDQEHVVGLSSRPDIHAVAIYQIESDLIRSVWFVK